MNKNEFIKKLREIVEQKQLNNNELIKTLREIVEKEQLNNNELIKKLRIIAEKEQLNNIKKLYKKRKGQFFSFIYLSDEKWEKENMKAESCNLGHHVIKITIGSMRSGVAYNHLKSTISKRMSQGYIPSSRQSYYTTEDNIIGKNKTKDICYVLGVPNGRCKSCYIVDGEQKTKQELIESGLMRESFSKRSDGGDWRTLKIKNVLYIF